MIDLKWLRDNPAAFDKALGRRGMEPAAASVLAVDEERRALETRLQEHQAERNRLSREVGEAKRRGDEAGAAAAMARVAELKDGLKDGEDRLREIQARLDATLAVFPNILADDVPDGPDESHNVELRRWGEPRRFDFAPRAHEELGARLGMDFAAAAKLSRRPVRGAARPARPAGAGDRGLHARPADRRARLHRGRPAATGARRGAVRHRPAAEVRRGSVPDHQRPLADPDRRGAADQPRRGRDPGRGGAAAALHGLHALLPLGGRRRRQGHARHDPPAPVQQGRAGERSPRRSSRRGRARAA